MHIKALGASLLMAGLCAGGAQAQNMNLRSVELGPYVSGGYNYFDFSEDLGGSGDVHAITGRAGWQFLPFLGAEAEISFGLNDDGFDFDSDEEAFNVDFNNDGDLGDLINGGGDLGMDYLVGVYGRVSLPVGERFQVYGRGGYAHVELDSTYRFIGNTVVASGSDDGVAFGGGLQFAISPNAFLDLGYTHYEFTDANAENLGAHLKFTF